MGLWERRMGTFTLNFTLTYIVWKVYDNCTLFCNKSTYQNVVLKTNSFLNIKNVNN